ncbi:MAG: aromatic ring-hydroxylating dioxygenase subunit alpha [Thermaceae bacterium]|nr:aromatic ring-hydroxylating dioxygenase subunit alpha [Thermaceae bacterium]
MSEILRQYWLPLALAAEVRTKGLYPVRLLGEEAVLVGLESGIELWQDLCIHRGTKLSLGRLEREQVICPYHGWVYERGGRCVRFPAHAQQTPPAKATARVYAAREQYGMVWGALEPPVADVPPFYEWGQPGFKTVMCGPYAFRASAPRVVENFLDVAHFPFVHEGLLGDQAHPEIPDYEVEEKEGRIRAKDIRVYQPNPDGTGVGRYLSYTYEVLAPLSAYFTKRDESGRVFSIFMSVTPVSELESLGWFYVAMNYGDQSSEEIRAFQDRVAMQDVPIVESQRPERLPLDLQAELHLRSDRVAIAYRSLLRRLGVGFGTA